ncbi:hypothetical protein HDU76_008325, partial [Blyttiomyces sp. JEL0837]
CPPGKTSPHPYASHQQVIVDTEHKTWSKLAAKSKMNTPTTFVDGGPTGRGNNWAYGYGDRTCADAVMEAVRVTLEKDDTSQGARGFLLINSLAGGTGSGLGARIGEDLREAYPNQFLMNCAVTPFVSGETTLQNYNALLSLASAQRYADVVSLFSNDHIINVSHLEKFEERIKLADLNEYIGQALAGLLLPSTPVVKDNSGTLNHFGPQDFDTWNLISQVVPVPKCKFVETVPSTGRASTKSTFPPFNGWDDVTSELLRNCPQTAPDKPRCYLTARVYARGAIGPEFWSRKDKILDRIKTRLGTSIFPASEATDLIMSSCYGRLMVATTIKSRRVLKSVFVLTTTAVDLKSPKKTLTLCSNSGSVLPTFSRIVDRSKKMYEAGAYLHWYERYAKEDTTSLFLDAFETIENVREGYEKYTNR